MKSTTYPSIWDAITDTPQETASMKARSKLMMALSDIISQRQLRQKDAAELFGVTQPRISDFVARQNPSFFFRHVDGHGLYCWHVARGIRNQTSRETRRSTR